MFFPRPIRRTLAVRHTREHYGFDDFTGSLVEPKNKKKKRKPKIIRSETFVTGSAITTRRLCNTFASVEVDVFYETVRGSRSMLSPSDIRRGRERKG